MFYVSIEQGVLDKVMERAEDSENEIIGILVGTIEEHTIVISDAISGEQEQEIARATLPPSTIAQVTDKILKGEVSGRIVGWYHSHPGFGIFMSHTDINTQKNLQQFSSKVTALIVDPDDGDYGFFTLHGEAGVVQLEKKQVHIYSEGEEKIPKEFEEPPKIPKKTPKRVRPAAGMSMPHPQERGPNKIMIIGIIAAAILASLSFLIFYENVDIEPDFSAVDVINLSGENRFNKDQNITIFNGTIGISAKISIVEGQIDKEGVRFYLSMVGGGWWILGNVTQHLNNTYENSFNSTFAEEGIHQIKVNFTDTLGQTWAASTRPFIIDNVEDIPIVRLIDPRNGDEIEENVTFLAEMADTENNIYTFGFYYRNDTSNWTVMNITERWPNRDFYMAILNTNVVGDGNLTVKVEAKDRNLYMGVDEIKVIVSNGD
jgi:proteasome lid subunit RPN8/RPN11